ncbi:MAG: hypothetical protein ABIL62_19580, partial [Planctomycetota bacterium]
MTPSMNYSSPNRVQTETIQQPISFARRIDLVLLGLLFSFILLYRLQLVAGWITVFRVREVLYAFLYIRVFLFCRPRMTKILFLVLLYLGYCLFVGIHTFYLYGAEMAISGFMRFVNVALLAPLAAIMITHKQQLKIFIKIWLAVAYLGAISGIYQFMGGDLFAITEGYKHFRGESIRYMTLLGEPNIGGMASPIVLLAAVYVLRNPIWKIITAVVSIVLLFLSVSKAGLAGITLAIFLIVYYEYKKTGHLIGKKLVRNMMYSISLICLGVVIFLIISINNPVIMEKIQEYSRTAITAVIGGGDRVDISPSLVDDLLTRVFTMTLDGIEIAKRESSFYPFNAMFGSSFGIAGTAAEELRGQDSVITPHNGFSEIYFVGGILMLFLFLVILFFVFRRLWWLAQGDNLFTALLA